MSIFSWRILGVLLLTASLCPTAPGDDRSENRRVAAKPSEESLPRYDKSGALERPQDFRKWIFVGSSLGLGYSKHLEKEKDRLFHNVYITPAAYEHYLQTSTFPEKTMLAMTVYRQDRKPQASFDLQGSYEGELLALEVTVKDSGRFEKPWAYFDFSPKEKQKTLRASAKPFPAAKCYNCHAEHAADDNVFVQFYPVLRRLKKQREGKKR